MSQRMEKVNELIKHELGQIILRELDIAKDILLTIIRVETSEDLSHASVYITVLPDTKEKEMLKELKSNEFDMQRELNKKLRMKNTPKIDFKIDDQAHAEQRIFEILSKENKEENER
jgi:ribosome-binding factor A